MPEEYDTKIVAFCVVELLE